MSPDDAWALDILTAARLILAFKGTIDKQAFLSDLKTRSSILHQLLVIGEAVKHLSPEFRAQRADVPWRSMAAMRDRLIHGYREVDFDEVWRTIHVDVVDLIGVLEPLAPREPNSEGGSGNPQ